MSSLAESLDNFLPMLRDGASSVEYWDALAKVHYHFEQLVAMDPEEAYRVAVKKSHEEIERLTPAGPWRDELKEATRHFWKRVIEKL